MEKLFISDPETKEPIEVLNLEESILQAEEFKKLGDSKSAFDLERRAYWSAIFKQLISLQKKL